MNQLIPFIIFPAITTCFIAIFWFIYGRDPYQAVPILVAPPKGMGILECGVLLDDAVNTKDIALELYNLHLKGFIIEQSQDSFILNPNLKEADLENLTLSQQLLINTVFNKADPFFMSKKAYSINYKKTIAKQVDNISDSAMDFLHKEYLTRLSKKIKFLKLNIYDLLTHEGYYPLSPFKQREPFIATGSVMFAVPIFLTIYTYFENYPKISLTEITQHPNFAIGMGISVAGLILTYSSFLFERKTPKGRNIKAQFLGFKEHIITAEKDRIRYVLQNDISAYKTILPFAALFDSLNQWIEPLREIEESLRPPELLNIEKTVTSLDVDVSITEKNRFIRGLFDLFKYGMRGD